MPAVEKELKAQIRGCGLTVKGIADSIKKPYGTLANWLNGFAPLPYSSRKQIEEMIKHALRGQAKSD